MNDETTSDQMNTTRLNRDAATSNRFSRRDFLRLSACLPAAALLARGGLVEREAQAASRFSLSPLPYDYSALEPHIDTRTMQLHHDKHHATYVKNLNEAMGKVSGARARRLQTRPLETMLRDLDAVPSSIRTAVRNNGGGHYNHSMFWRIMKPNGGGEPTGAIGAAIKSGFGSFNNFQYAFNRAGEKRFGSGWTWLAADKKGALHVLSTPNQDNPLMMGMFPIMGNDVWEHAYYLKYQNRRAAYLRVWWNVVNWDEVNRRLAVARA